MYTLCRVDVSYRGSYFVIKLTDSGTYRVHKLQHFTSPGYTDVQMDICSCNHNESHLCY